MDGDFFTEDWFDVSTLPVYGMALGLPMDLPLPMELEREDSGKKEGRQHVATSSLIRPTSTELPDRLIGVFNELGEVSTHYMSWI